MGKFWEFHGSLIRLWYSLMLGVPAVIYGVLLVYFWASQGSVVPPAFGLLLLVMFSSLFPAFLANRRFGEYILWYWGLVLPVSLFAIVALSMTNMGARGLSAPLIGVLGTNLAFFLLGPIIDFSNRWGRDRKQARLHANMPDWKKKDLPE